MSKKPRDKKDTVYTYFKIEYVDCANVDYDYTIVESLDDVRDNLQIAYQDLDDPELEATVIITGIGMTVAEYEKWFKENVE